MLHGLIAAVLAVDVIRVRSGVPGEGGDRRAREKEKEHNRLTRKLGGATRRDEGTNERRNEIVMLLPSPRRQPGVRQL